MTASLGVVFEFVKQLSCDSGANAGISCKKSQEELLFLTHRQNNTYTEAVHGLASSNHYVDVGLVLAQASAQVTLSAVPPPTRRYSYISAYPSY